MTIHCSSSSLSNERLIAIFQDKVAKLANYFLSRKHVHQLKAAYQFVSVIKTLADNKVKCRLLGWLNFNDSKKSLQVKD